MRFQEESAPTRGARAEDRALEYLHQYGLQTVQRNYRCRRGEIDLIMHDGGVLVFVEVRFRVRGDFGSGAETVDKRKRRKLTAAANHYLVSKHTDVEQACRFDVISILGEDEQEHIDWIQNAFDAALY